MTDLEWKLRVAGAGDKTVERAKSRRSKTSVELELRSGLVDGTDAELDDLSERVLEHADGVTADIVGTAASTALSHRPAEAIYGRLVQQVGQLGLLDKNGVLSGEGDLVLGLLCELSDQCRYGWRSA